MLSIFVFLLEKSPKFVRRALLQDLSPSQIGIERFQARHPVGSYGISGMLGECTHRGDFFFIYGILLAP